MDISAFHGIDPGGVDTGMAQDVRQSDDILFQTVISPGKQMPQIMRKYLFSAHLGGVAEFFHFCPDVAPVQRLALRCDEDASGANLMIFCVFQKGLTKFGWQKKQFGFCLSAAHWHSRTSLPPP